MADEIDLLRRFRADTPGPDQAAWDRAWAAIADAGIPSGSDGRGPLGAADDPDGPAGVPARLGEPRPGEQDRSPHLQPLRHPRRWHRWRASGALAPVATIVAVAAAMIAAVLVTVLTPPPDLAGPVTTAWQRARPLPVGTAPAGLPAQAPPGTWRLTAYLVAQDWQTSTAGPGPGALTCPTAATCFVEGDNATSASGPPDMRTLYVSADGARTWSVLPVPDDVTFTSSLACASATSCAAGGLYAGHQPVYLSTADGGHSWTIRPLAHAVGQLLSLQCATATSCRGLASATGQPMSPGIVTLLARQHYVVTADGGRHFTVVNFPAGEAIQSVSCPTATHCVAIGVSSHFNDHDGPDLDHGFLLTSDDGGLTWRQRDYPKGYGPGAGPVVTCSDATHCAMLGFIERDGTLNEGYGMSESGQDAIQYDVVAFSADGGVTWRTSTLPSAIPYPLFNALTCPTAQTCYAAGGDLIPEHIGNTYNAGSAVVAYTTDAGRSWHRVSFDVPAQVPAGMQGDSFLDIGQLQCPQAGACVALGISDQGSSSTPIYTNHG